MTAERKEGKLLCQMLKYVLGEKVEDIPQSLQDVGIENDVILRVECGLVECDPVIVFSKVIMPQAHAQARYRSTSFRVTKSCDTNLLIIEIPRTILNCPSSDPCPPIVVMYTQFSFRYSRQLWRIQTTVTLRRREWQQLFYWRSVTERWLVFSQSFR